MFSFNFPHFFKFVMVLSITSSIFDLLIASSGMEKNLKISGNRFSSSFPKRSTDSERIWSF